MEELVREKKLISNGHTLSSTTQKRHKIHKLYLPAKMLNAILRLTKLIIEKFLHQRQN